MELSCFCNDFTRFHGLHHLCLRINTHVSSTVQGPLGTKPKRGAGDRRPIQSVSSIEDEVAHTEIWKIVYQLLQTVTVSYKSGKMEMAPSVKHAVLGCHQQPPNNPASLLGFMIIQSSPRRPQMTLFLMSVFVACHSCALTRSAVDLRPEWPISPLERLVSPPDPLISSPDPLIKIKKISRTCQQFQNLSKTLINH